MLEKRRLNIPVFYGALQQLTDLISTVTCATSEFKSSSDFIWFLLRSLSERSLRTSAYSRTHRQNEPRGEAGVGNKKCYTFKDAEFSMRGEKVNKLL